MPENSGLICGAEDLEVSKPFTTPVPWGEIKVGPSDLSNRGDQRVFRGNHLVKRLAKPLMGQC